MSDRKYISTFNQVRFDDEFLASIDSPGIMNFRDYMYYLIEIEPNAKNWVMRRIDDSGLSFKLPKEITKN